MSFAETQATSTIERCPHDQENPYAQISRALIRDNRISPNCRMILIYLLSNDETKWVIRPAQIYKQFKNFLGRDTIYKLIDEAIEAGYIRREEYLQGNLKRYKYYLSERPKFKNCFLLPEPQYTGAPDTEGQGTLERTCEERTSKKKEHIIAQPPPPPKGPPPKEMPAGGNNNFFKSLEICIDLSDRQKRMLMKYPEHLVNQAVRYAYHPTTQITGGPVGRIKLLQYFLKNPEDFRDKMENLDKPRAPSSKKDVLLGKFKRGEIYNGYEFLQDDIGVGFYKSGMYQPYSVRWDSLNFVTEFLRLIKKCGIDEPG